MKRIQQAKLREIAAPRGRGASKKRGGSAVEKIQRMHAFHMCHHEMHVHEAVFYQTALHAMCAQKQLLICLMEERNKKIAMLVRRLRLHKKSQKRMDMGSFG